MCFIKSSSGASQVVVKKPDPVIRHQADSDVTKTSRETVSSGYIENLKTSPQGLVDTAPSHKKTLLGE